VAAHQLDTDETVAAVRVGRTLRDKWHLDALIDVGGMAAVYAATHRNGMHGAVKILHRHRSLDPDIAARFRREGYIANKVAHPNAVKVLDDDVDDDGSVFLVMELLEGSTLRERADSSGGKLGADEVLLVVDQLLDVLAVAHDASIIHRDVKPENVFLTIDGQVKILDFGIARLYEPSSAGHSDTVAGMPMGSPAFMSPEQARGRWDLVDAQSDVWSVGATMFTLLSGHDVHTEETVPELLASIFTNAAPSLATAVLDCHPALSWVADRALQLRLADRWPDARAMQAAVRAAYLEMFGTPLPEAVLPARARPQSLISHDDLLGMSHAPKRSATTVIAAEVPGVGRRRYPQRVALASALLLAATLGALGVLREPGGHETRHASAVLPQLGALAELGEETPSLPSAPVPPPAVIPPRGAVATPPLRLPQAGYASPSSRAHHPSVYDRRY